MSGGEEESLPEPLDWWDDLLPDRISPHPPGAVIMLYLIVYDISSPQRWRRIAAICEDYGARVQYSVFECWLDRKTFDRLWEKLEEELDPESDRIAAWPIDGASADKRRGMGEAMTFTEQRRDCYVI